jgi:hypothetical protein
MLQKGINCVKVIVLTGTYVGGKSLKRGVDLPITPQPPKGGGAFWVIGYSVEQLNS